MRMQENMDQIKLQIMALFMQWYLKVLKKLRIPKKTLKILNTDQKKFWIGTLSMQCILLIKTTLKWVFLESSWPKYHNGKHSLKIWLVKQVRLHRLYWKHLHISLLQFKQPFHENTIVFNRNDFLTLFLF